MNNYFELNHVIAIALRRWWLIIVLTAIGASFGFLISQRQTPVYEATTTILVGDIIESTNLDRTDILTSQMVAATYVQMIPRQPVLEGVVQSLDLEKSWRQLRNQVKANLVEGTQLIQIRAEAASPFTAQLIADEIAHQIISFSPTQNQFKETEDTHMFVQGELESLQSRLESGRERRASLEKELSITSSTEQLDEVQKEIDVLDGLITEWESNYTQLLFFLGNRQSPNNLTIFEPSQASLTPVRPKVQIFIIIGSGVGILLALGLIFSLEYLDDSIKSIEGIKQSFDLLLLGSIPNMKGLGYNDKLAGLQDHLSSITEVFRLVGGNLRLYSMDGSQKAIMITSPNQTEGKSLILASLGTVLAQAGLSTIIVDANLRRPVVHEIFNGENKKGLMDLLTKDEYNMDDYLCDTQQDNLRLLTIGTSELNPSSLLKHSQIKRVISSLKEQAEVILFDSSSALDHADSVFLSTQMDDVILVVAAKRTKNDELNKLIQNLELANANISGVIFNKYLPGKLSLIFNRIRSSIRKRSLRRQSKQGIASADNRIFQKSQASEQQEGISS